MLWAVRRDAAGGQLAQEEVKARDLQIRCVGDQLVNVTAKYNTFIRHHVEIRHCHVTLRL